MPMARRAATQEVLSGARPDHEQRLLQFVSDAAHEVVAPVNQVASLAGLLVNRYRGQLDEDAETLLVHIQSAGARAATVAAGLRTYFRILGSERMRTHVNTVAAIESAVAALKLEIEECNAEIDYGPLADVEGDAHLLSQLFQILIQNCLQFRREDSRPQIAISSQCASMRCLFSVTDNGIGIDPEYNETVFNPFTKLTGPSSPGAGLGLTLARAIVEIQNGRVWIENPPAQGTTVCFELPEAES